MRQELRQLAQQVYDRLGNSEEGLASLVQLITDHGLDREAVRYAAEEMLAERMRAARQKINGGNGNGGFRADRTPDPDEKLAQDSALEWDYPLQGDFPLSEATEMQIDDQIELHERNIKGNRLAVRFLRRVREARRAAGCPADSATGSKLSPAELKAIHDEVYGATRAA